MNVGWTRGCVHAFVGKKVSELTREKFSRVITVESAHHTSGRVASFVEKCCETGEKESDVFRSFVFVAQHVDGFEPSVIVDDNESIAASSVDGGKERSGYVHVNEAARV
eukprot:1871171-Pleurochrysis_carterae.AAC.1